MSMLWAAIQKKCRATYFHFMWTLNLNTHSCGVGAWSEHKCQLISLEEKISCFSGLLLTCCPSSSFDWGWSSSSRCACTPWGLWSPGDGSNPPVPCAGGAWQSIILLFNKFIVNKNINLKVQSAQIGSALEWYHWIGLERTSTAIGFLYFIFDLEYLIRAQSSELLHDKMNPTSYFLDHGLHVLKCFSAKMCSKMRERHQLFFGLQLVSKEFQHPAIQTKIEQHFGRFFHQI